MNYDFDSAVPRKGTFSLKWDDNAFFQQITPGLRLDDDTIRMILADMDFSCAPAVVDAMHRVADFRNYGYTSLDAAPAYRQAIVDWYRKRFGLTLKPEWIIHSNGALDGVGQTIQAFSSPGDGVVICRPIYRNFTQTIERMGRQVVNVPMLCPQTGQYLFDWDGLERAFSCSRNKVFILCSPQNPVGRVWTKDELAALLALCRKHNVTVVSDEIHSDIVRKGIQHCPIIAATEDISHVVMVSGVNKSFNLMGLQCAYTIIPDDGLRKRFMTNYDPTSPSAFAIAAMTAAYNESADWLDQLNAYLDDELASTVAAFQEQLPGLKAYVPEGTYVLWLDFSAYGYSPELLMELINHRGNVALQRGTAHDPEKGAPFMRMCVTSPKQTALEAVRRIAAQFREYEKAR